MIENKNQLIILLGQYLETQLKEKEIANNLAAIFVEQLLTWEAPVVDLSTIGGIISFAFGNRMLPNGNVQPGPVNSQLADATVNMYLKTQAVVYAQWEIAELIDGRIPSKNLVALYPETNPTDGIINYLSTIGVVNKVLSIIKTPSTLGKVLVLAFKDSAFRAVTIARKYGFDAYTPPIDLPNKYDPESGQPWTRSRLAYIFHDMLARLDRYRKDRFGFVSPIDRNDRLIG
jgi:hypothetical protein